MRRDSAAAEVAECTFAPAIDGRSKSLMAMRTQALQASPSGAEACAHDSVTPHSLNAHTSPAAGYQQCDVCYCSWLC